MRAHPSTVRKKRSRGFGIIVVLGFTAVLAVFTAVIGARAAENLALVDRQGQTDQAYYAALTGLHVSLGYLFEPPAAASSAMAEWLENDRSIRFRLRERTEAAAHLFHNVQGFEGSRPVADDGTVIPPDHFYIISMGEVNADYNQDGEAVGGVRVRQNMMGSLIAPDFPVMPYALFGFEQVYVDGRVDHFDSNVSFSPVVGESGDHMDCPFPDASVGASRTEADAIVLGSQARVDGHAVLGHGSVALHDFAGQYPVAVPPRVESDPIPAFGSKHAWGGGGYNERLNGVVSRLGVDRERRIISLPEDVITLGSNLYIGSTQYLTGGKNYYVRGNLTVGSGGRLIVQNDGGAEARDVVLYVDGNITFDGTTGINRDSAPARLKIFSLSQPEASSIPQTTFRMNSESRAHCLVSGNNLQAVIDGNSELWGAVLGDVVRLESGAVHFDTQLRDPVALAGTYGFSVLSNSTVPHSRFPLNHLAPPAHLGAGTGGTTGGTSGGGIGGDPAPGGPGLPPDPGGGGEEPPEPQPPGAGEPDPLPPGPGEQEPPEPLPPGPGEPEPPEPLPPGPGGAGSGGGSMELEMKR